MNLKQMSRPATLSGSMKALSPERESPPLAWSRPWNKAGLTIFRAHRLCPRNDRSYIAPVGPMLVYLLRNAETAVRSFALDLFVDPNLFAFIFYHQRIAEDGAIFEGFTLSLGRKFIREKNQRDRLDLAFEDRCEGGAVDGVIDKLWIFIRPRGAGAGQERGSQLLEMPRPGVGELRVLQPFYDRTINLYHVGKEVSMRRRDHWSTRYIDSFGTRQFIPLRSSFSGSILQNVCSPLL